MGNKPIVHAPIATGSTEPRDIRDRFADFVNLKDFGAVGDGVTDDSTAWVAWQTALASGGMPYIPAGDYLLGEDVIHAPKGHLGRNANSFTYEDDGVVLGELEAPIYVDAVDGSDDNDGLTLFSAFKTIQKAIDSYIKVSSNFVVKIAAGTYEENINIENGKHVVLQLLGNVSLNGKIFVNNSSLIHVIGENSNKLNISYQGESTEALGADCHVIHISNNSCFISDCDIDCSVSTGYISSVFYIKNNSTFVVNNSLEITCNTSNTSEIFAIAIYYKSVCILNNQLSISSTNAFFAGVQTFNGTFIANNCSITMLFDMQVSSSNFAFRCYNGSFVWVNGCELDLTARRPIEGIKCYIDITFSGIIKFNWQCVFAGECASISISSTSTGELKSNDSNTGRFFLAQRNSSINLYGSNIIKLTGSVSTCVAYAVSGSIITIPSYVPFTGSNVTGKRYVANTFSMIDVYGQGANRIPGTIAGTVATGGYYM